MKFSSKPILEHAEVPLADSGRLEEIVDYWTQREAPCGHESTEGNSSYVASIGAERDPQIRKAQLAEIVNLASAQGDRVVGEEICRLAKINPRTHLGSGAAQALASRARACGANMLVLDAELSPSQLRNLEDAAGIAICDREAVILNVFLRHAKSGRAKIQVEIAQLEYLRPRIRGVGINMDQQAGGLSKGRGPGETASELMARKLDGRLEELKKALRKIGQVRATQQNERQACKRIVLVGYTNAGKTSLMNALTDAGLSARDMPFETLDTTSRSLSRHGGDVLLSDTVGFIRNLPERLLSSFESTLAEIVEASLLVLVIDAADCERELHLEITLGLLQKLGAEKIPRLFVFNKIDRLAPVPEDSRFVEASRGFPWIALSSRDADAVEKLKDKLLHLVRSEEVTTALFVPYSATDVMAMVYGKCRVLGSEAAAAGLSLNVQGSEQIIAQILARLAEMQS